MKENNIFVLPGYFLFFLMLFVPVTYKPIKILLVGIVSIIIICSFIVKRERNLAVNRSVLFLTFFFTLIGALFVLIGIFRGNPGALQESTVNFFWPWLYLIFIIGINNKSILKNLLKIMVYSSIIIEIYSLVYVLINRGILPSYLYIPINMGQSIWFYEGYATFSLYNTGSLVFLLPFVAAALCVWKSEKKINIKRTWLWISLILGVLVLMLSGRRAFILTSAFSPFIILLLVNFLPKTIRKDLNSLIRRLVIIISLFVVLGVFYLKIKLNYNFSSFTNMITSAFNFHDTSNESAYERVIQTKALIKGWEEHPFFGSGFGASAEVIRNNQMPWTYEMQYLQYLFHVGLVGVILYFTGIIWILFQGVKLIKKGTLESLMVIPVLVGSICFLIANSSNPYLTKYDFLWTIFLPVAFVNYYLTHKSLLEEIKDTNVFISNEIHEDNYKPKRKIASKGRIFRRRGILFQKK